MLLVSIADHLSKVLDAITSETLRAKWTCEMMRFGLTALNTSTVLYSGAGVEETPVKAAYGLFDLDSLS